MGPKLKKPPKNPFSFYLDDYVESQRKIGRKVSHRIAAEECGPSWTELSQDEKRKYIELAALHKEYSKEDKKNKFTNTGISYAALEQKQREQRLKIEKTDAEIRETINHLDSSTLKTHFFYIIHCNYYCKTDNNVYLPGELAISEFNLEDGIRRTYHTLISPDRIPTGYAYEVKLTIAEVHGLPEPPFEEGDSDYYEILTKILNFLEPGKLSNGKYPPLYATDNNLKASESVLRLLCETRNEDADYFRVFPLHKMFFWLKNKCVEHTTEENVGFPVISVAEREIARDLYAYAPGISCFYHSGCDDKYQNCSLSVVQRHVYLICDHCCQYVNVELVPGKHSRYKADVKGERSYSSLPLLSEIDYDGRSSYASDFTSFDEEELSPNNFESGSKLSCYASTAGSICD